MSDIILEAKGVVKSFANPDGGEPCTILRQVDAKVAAGEFVCVVGRSGSGKSTLLNVLSTLLRPEAGLVTYKGEDLGAASEARLNELRGSDFSMIFQLHHLLPYLTAFENTLVPFLQRLRPVGQTEREAAAQALARVGLSAKHDRLPGKLSGGEQQRVAIARALAKRPSVLFADEPTGSLDKKTGDEIMRLLRDLTGDGVSVVMVTHDPGYASLADRVIEMADGQVIENGPLAQLCKDVCQNLHPSQAA